MFVQYEMKVQIRRLKAHKHTVSIYFELKQQTIFKTDYKYVLSDALISNCHGCGCCIGTFAIVRVRIDHLGAQATRQRSTQLQRRFVLGGRCGSGSCPHGSAATFEDRLCGFRRTRATGWRFANRFAELLSTSFLFDSQYFVALLAKILLTQLHIRWSNLDGFLIG